MTSDFKYCGNVSENVRQTEKKEGKGERKKEVEKEKRKMVSGMKSTYQRLQSRTKQLKDSMTLW